MFDTKEPQKYCIKIVTDGDEDETWFADKAKAQQAFNTAVQRWDAGGVVSVVGDRTATALHSKDINSILFEEED